MSSISGRAAEAVEQPALHEHGLVAGGDAAEARARVHERGHHAEQRVATVDAHVEAAPGRATRHGRSDQGIGVVGEVRVGVQEQQHLAARHVGAGVELRGAPARRLQHAVGQRRGQRGRAVLAAAIDHDEFRPARAQRLQRGQPLGQRRRLVQHRHDDRQAHADSARSKASKPSRTRAMVLASR
jgi:hypothetical protein